MRVALVSEHASPLAAIRGADAGGQNVHVAALARELALQGDEVEVLTRHDDAELDEVVEIDGYRVRHVTAGPPEPIPKDAIWNHVPLLARRLHELWAARRPDVVHSHFWMSGAAAALAAAEHALPLAHTYHALGTVKRRHQGAADTSPPARIPVERQVGNAADCVIATCSDEVFELRRMGVAAPVSVIPCGVDLHSFRPAPRPAREPDDGALRLLCAGRLVERKGIDLVIRALARTTARLTIVGADGGGEENAAGRLRRLAGECGVADRVSFAGAAARAAMPDAINAADAVVCVPWYEPFGIVPLEAGACERPVIAAAVGGLADTVVHERTGLLVPPRDVEAIGDAINRLDRDRSFARELGRAAGERMHERYGWPRVASATARVYGQIAGEHAELERVSRSSW